jgi:cytochrome d ubiquinol oxidase subunit I
MGTADGVSPIATSQVVVSLLGFTLVYGLLGAVDFYLLAQNAKKGPVEESDAAAQTALEAATA